MLGERVMRNGMLIAVTLFTFLFSSGAEAGIFGKKKDTDEQRQEVLDMREETLSRLYGEKASADTGINVLLVSTANGSGIAHDNKSGADVYMKMFSAGGGIGLGVKKFSAVFVFHSRDAYDQFVEGRRGRDDRCR
jgi:hypothetical protein